MKIYNFVIVVVLISMVGCSTSPSTPRSPASAEEFIGNETGNKGSSTKMCELVNQLQQYSLNAEDFDGIPTQSTPEYKAFYAKINADNKLTSDEIEKLVIFKRTPTESIRERQLNNAISIFSEVQQNSCSGKILSQNPKENMKQLIAISNKLGNVIESVTKYEIAVDALKLMKESTYQLNWQTSLMFSDSLK